jgi:hypothetical protein
MHRRRATVGSRSIEYGELRAADDLPAGWTDARTAARNARAVAETHVMAFDGNCLRGKFRDDPALGYAVLTIFTRVIVERLPATRLRLLDVYGKFHGEPVPGP